MEQKHGAGGNAYMHGSASRSVANRELSLRTFGKQHLTAVVFNVLFYHSAIGLALFSRAEVNRLACTNHDFGAPLNGCGTGPRTHSKEDDRDERKAADFLHFAPPLTAIQERIEQFRFPMLCGMQIAGICGSYPR